MPSRHIELQGASNFRDCGGYLGAGGKAVKWRRLFRSDQLTHLTEADYQTLDALGLRLVCDLRRNSELRDSPTKWPSGAGRPELFHLPVFKDASSSVHKIAALGAPYTAQRSREVMSQLYVRLLTEPHSLAAFGQLFERLAAPAAWPALFHCAGGKDRTGVACALVLSAIGVSRDDIVEDFMLTGNYFKADEQMFSRVSQIISRSEMQELPREALMPIFGVDRYYIEAALQVVDAEGGIERFLTEKVGVPLQHLERLQEDLLA